MPQRRARGRAGAGNVMALEGIMIGLLVLGAMLYVANFQLEGSSAPRARDSMAKAAADSLDVLSGLPASEDAYGRAELTKLVTESLYGRTSNLTLKLDGFLPKGTLYNVWLDNGVAARPLWTGGSSSGERVSAARGFQPSWSVAFVQPDFATYDGSLMLMNATELPIARGNAITYDADLAQPHVVFPNGVKLTLMNGTGVPSQNDSYVRAGATIGYPTAGTLRLSSNASWTYRGAVVRGSAPYAVVSDTYLGSSYKAARDALNASTLGVGAWNEATQTLDATRIAKLGANFTVKWDFTQYVNAHAGHFASGSSNATAVRVYAPVPMLNTTVGLYYAEWRSSSAGYAGSTTFPVPRSALLGPHLVVAELNTTFAGSSGAIAESARLFERVDVALEDGALAVDPVYRVVIEAWAPEWG